MGTGPGGSVFGGNSFYREPLGQSTLWGSIKRIFPEYWTQVGQRGATIPTTSTSSRTWTFSGWATRVSELRLIRWRPPSSCTPGFSIKRIFPKYWTAAPGTDRTLLQYPHGPVPELCLALPWCTAAGGTLYRSPVPIYPLELDKTNPQLALGPVPELWLRGGVGYPGVRTTFNHMATPLLLYPGFLDKTKFPWILIRRARYPQDPSTYDNTLS